MTGVVQCTKTMEGPSFLEEPLLATIDSQLSEAVAELEDVSHQDLDSITRQKLILDAVHHFGVQDSVTTQYYLHGDVAVKGKEQNRLSNATLQVPEGINGDLPSDEEIYEYFTSVRAEYLKNALRSETFEWLESYYREKEDVPFEGVYLAGLPIYRKLHTLREAVRARKPGDIPSAPHESVSENTRALKQELARFPMFQDILPYVTEFEKAALDSLKWVESKDWTTVENGIFEHYEFVDALYDLFYEGLWKACGQQMSYNTVEGPSAEETRERREREIGEQRVVFQHKYNKLEFESDILDVVVEANVDRLPDLEPADHEPEQVIPEDELEEVPHDDPAFSILGSSG